MQSILSHDRAAVFLGDALKLSDLLPDNSVDSIVTDPPYELGFMGKKWDGTGIAYSVDLWREVLRVLKPGGYLLAFGGTRTYHRMTCAIEDAGFEIRDCLTWNYKTGFPKSKNLGEGRGSGLKPALEPIVLARKALIGTLAANVAAHGTGGLNIDSCRIGEGTGAPPSEKYAANHGNAVFGKGMGGGVWDDSKGKWPANAIFDDSDPALEPYFFCVKPSRKERDLGCDALPQRSGGEATDREDGSAGVDNPRAGAGRTGGARNYHPTVKPIELMRYLVRLVTPPGGVVLDPFTGSGTTGIAALREGCQFIGVEQSKEYTEIAKPRLEHALSGKGSP